MDTRGETKFVSATGNNSSKPQQQQHHDERNQEIDHHLMVSGLYDDDETHTRKSSISFDKIKQISLTYSLQSEDGSQETSNDTFEQNCQDEYGLGTAANRVVNDRRRDSSGSNQFCLSQADDDASEGAESRKLSVIEMNLINKQQASSENLYSIQQQDSTNNNDPKDVHIDEENVSSPKFNTRANFDGGANYYESDKVEGNLFAQNTIPSYLKSNPFAFDQSGRSSSGSNNNNNNKSKSNNRIADRNHSNISGARNIASNSNDKLGTNSRLNEHDNSIIESEQLLSARGVCERNRAGGDCGIYSRPQYYRDGTEDIQIGKLVNRHTRRHRQHQHQPHDQSAVSLHALSESAGSREKGRERVVGDDATLIMGDEISTPANIVGVNCSPRRKQLPQTNSNSPAAVSAMNDQQQQPLPTPATGGYPRRDHYISRRTMAAHRPQQQQQYGQLPPPSMQQLNSILRATPDHSRSSSQDRIVARTSRSSTGPGSERNSTTNGSSTELRFKQHNSSISLVLFNKTDANIIINDEPSESCSEGSCWGSSLPPNSSIGLGRTIGVGIDNSLAFGQQAGANDDDAGVEGNDYLSEEDLVNCSNEMFHHDDASSNRDKNTTLLRRASAGEFIGSGVDSNSRLTSAPSMTTQTRVLNQRLDSGALEHQNHHNQRQMFHVEKFVERPISQSTKTTGHKVREDQDLATNISVIHRDDRESLIFENQGPRQQQQSSSSLSSIINETSLNNSYRHQLPAANQVRNNNSAYSEDNHNSPQFFGNSSSSQSPLGIDMQPMGASGSKNNFDLISGASVNPDTRRNLGGSRDQLKRDPEDRTIRIVNDVAGHSLAR